MTWQMDRKGWLVWWAYLGEDTVPKQTSLCALFWRTVLWGPVKLGCIGIILWAMGFVLWQIWLFPWTFGFVISAIVTAGLTGTGLIVGGKRVVRSQAFKDARLTVVEGAYAIKHNLCPIIQLVYKDQ